MDAWAVTPHLLGFAMPLLVVICAMHGGAWLLAPAAVFFGIVPLLDRLVGRDLHVRSGYEIATYDRNQAFRVVMWAWVLIELMLLWWAIAWASAAPRAPIELVGLILSAGATTGVIGAAVGR